MRPLFVALAPIGLSLYLITACSPLAKKSEAPPAAALQDLPTPIKSPSDTREYAAFILPNQMKVVVVSDPSTQTAAASLNVKVGSANDPDNYLGLAHYFEHMLFLGSAKYPEPDAYNGYIQAHGGHANAFTQFENTNYFFTVQVKHFAEALDRFSNTFKAPLLNETFADKERQAVHNEWSMQSKQDNWIINRIEAITGNPQHPSARFSIGNLDTLKNQPNQPIQKALKDFYAQYYSANLMQLTLVSNQPIAQLKQLAIEHFSAINNHNATPTKITQTGISPENRSQRIYYKPQKNQAWLGIEFPYAEDKSQWRYQAGSYLNYLLSSEEPGTAAAQLRAAGLINGYFIEMNSHYFGADGRIKIEVSLTEQGLKQEDTIIATLLAYTQLIKQKGLNPNYYRELKAIREKSFAQAGNANPSHLAIQLSQDLTDWPAEHLLNKDAVFNDYNEAHLKQTLDQLNPTQMRIWHLNAQAPVNTPVPFFAGEYSVKPITPEEQARYSQQAQKIALQLPALNNLFTETSRPLVDMRYEKPQVITRKPGLEVFLQHPQKHKEDKGLLSLEINSPLGTESIKNSLLAELVNGLYLRHSQALINRAHNANLGLTPKLAGANSQSFFIAGATEKHAELLHTAVQAFVQMPFTQVAFEQEAAQLKKNLLDEKTRKPFNQLYALAHQHLSSSGWSAEKGLATLEHLTLADAQAYHQALLKAPLVRLLAVGNYTPEEVTAMGDDLSRLLPSQRALHSYVMEGFKFPEASQVVHAQQNQPQADSALMQLWIAQKASVKDMAQLHLLSTFFSQAFFNQLRTQEQLGYVAQATPFSRADVPGFALVLQSSSATLPHLKARMDAFRKDYANTLKNLSPEAFETSKNALLTQMKAPPGDFYQEANLYAEEFWMQNTQYNRRENYIKALEAVTLNDIINAYNRFIGAPKLGQLLLQIRGENAKGSPFAEAKP